MPSIKSSSKNKFGTTYLNMIQAVCTFVFSPVYIAITQSIAAFNTLMLAVQTNLNAVEALRQSISNPITGPAAQKKLLKKQLAQQAAVVMKAAYTYAQDSGDETLAAQMKTSVSQLLRLKYVDICTRTQTVVTTLTPIISSLATYNVQPSDLTAIQTTATTLSTIIANPKNEIAIRKAINIQIQSLLRGTMEMLINQCDELAFQFIADNKTYYDTYRANRKLNPNHMSTQLRAHVNNILGAPVTEGEVFILGTDRSGTLDNTGYCLVDNIPIGSHQVAVTTPGGTTTTFGPYDFKLGHSLTEYFIVPVQSETKAGETTTAPATPAKTATGKMSSN